MPQANKHTLTTLAHKQNVYEFGLGLGLIMILENSYGLVAIKDLLLSQKRIEYFLLS